MIEWINIKDELPEINSTVIISVFDKDTQISNPYFAVFSRDKRFHSENTGEIFQGVTHWAYYKKPPISMNKVNKLTHAKNEVIDENKITRESLMNICININNVIHSLNETVMVINELLSIK